MKLIKYLIILLMCMPAQTVFAAQTFLNNNEIKQMISGRSMTFYGKYKGIKFTGAAKWYNNGRIKGYTRFLGTKRIWQGTWYVKNNRYCRTLTSQNRSDSKCHRVKKINANTIQFIKPNGSVSSTTVLK